MGPRPWMGKSLLSNSGTDRNAATQGMQFFRFIFLARSWESDRKRLSRELARLGQAARDQDLPLSFLFFPEGTVVSRDTRPRSKKFAEREGIVSTFHSPCEPRS
jgi:1-acyl-sn-glycerol-3-phosphate acyltransferase